VNQTPAEKCYDQFWRQASRALEAGDLQGALAVLDGAWEWARTTGDERLVDRVYCNRSAVAIELGETEGIVGRLREVLLRNSDEENCHLSAYQIARVYELRKAYKKGLFYARIALDHAVNLQRSDWQAFCRNQIGNLLLAESHFEKACAEYDQALSLAPSDRGVWRARIVDNVGYCRILQGRHQEGFRLLFESLRTLRRATAERYEISSRLDLSFAYLEIGRYRRALRHGTRALQLAEAAGDRESVKNALYLLGEAANLSRNTLLAQRYFSRLQREFYPEADYIPDFLLAVDVRKLINLKA
jgi:tetratricopeptide (TPR) repeat protein